MTVERERSHAGFQARSRATGVGVLVALMALAARAEAAYTLVDLGGDPSGAGAVAISSDGSVAGYEMYGPFMPHATLFAHGRRIDLGTLGGDASFANGVGSGDRVVGWARLSDATRHAFLYEGGVMHDLGTLGGEMSNAFAMNDAGVVVGSSIPAGGGYEVPMVWTAGEGMRALLSPDVLGGQALGVNARGQIVGYYLEGADIQAYLYENGVTRTLGTLGGFASKAYAISRSGLIAGYSLTPDPISPKFHAVIWDDDGIHDLGAMGGGHGTAYDVNDAGVAVGFSYDAEFVQIATVFRDGALRDLNRELPAGSPWHLSMATGITEDGIITGSGTLDGFPRVYALVPDGAPGEPWGLPSIASLRSWPQPMRDSGTLELTLSGSVAGRLWLYDVAGRRVADLGGGSFTRGTVTVPIPASVISRLDSGVYFARLEGPGVSLGRRVVLTR